MKVYVTPIIRLEDGSFPSYYYIVLTCLYISHKVIWFFSPMALSAFNNRISDPLVGGTYMTLLNTFMNLGGVVSKSFSLWFVGLITFK